MKLELTLEYYNGIVTLDGKEFTFDQTGGRWFVYDSNGLTMAPHSGFRAASWSKAIARVLEIVRLATED